VPPAAAGYASGEIGPALCRQLTSPAWGNPLARALRLLKHPRRGDFAVAGKSDVFLKVTTGLAFLIAAASVGYYFVVYLPDRDARLDAELRMEKARTELARKAEEERLRSEKEAAELKATTDRETIKANYDQCLRLARANYDYNWGLNCKQVSDRNRKSRTDCQSSASSKEVAASCDRIFPQIDPNGVWLTTFDFVTDKRRLR
jgi:hypothetical protein